MDGKTLIEKYKLLRKPKSISPKEQFIRDLAKLCRVKPSTVRCWVTGIREPNQLTKEAIARELGEEVETLFPSKIGKG